MYCCLVAASISELTFLASCLYLEVITIYVGYFPAEADLFIITAPLGGGKTFV